MNILCSYGKFTKGKDLSSRSHEDLKCIFGKRAVKPTSGKDSPALESAVSYYQCIEHLLHKQVTWNMETRSVGLSDRLYVLSMRKHSIFLQESL